MKITKMLAFLLMGGIAFPAFSAPQKYMIDPMHTEILWHISHFDFSYPTGKWSATGEIIYDEEKLENSKATVTIEVAKMVTGIDELNKHLKGSEFFDVARYPKATFVSEKVELEGDKIAKIQGKLTLKGVTKPVTLNVKLNKKGKSLITEEETLGFAASTSIKRSDFGMITLLPGLGDEVKLEIQTEAHIPSEKEKVKKNNDTTKKQ